METPQNSPNISFQDDKEITYRDAKTELQLTKDEVEQVNKDVNKCREDDDDGPEMDEGLRNEKKSLANQLEELILSCTAESERALLRSLREEEHNLKLRREQLRKADASANTQEGTASRNLLLEFSVRKRGTRK
uniref:Si:ch211-167j6.3 n=1 Tax=Cyprinus carpio TaxID=7962 RepID=A0A8C1YMS0_CYPCA